MQRCNDMYHQQRDGAISTSYCAHFPPVPVLASRAERGVAISREDGMDALRHPFR